MSILRKEGLHHFGEFGVGGEVFKEGEVAVAPVGGNACAGDIDALIAGIGGDESGIEGKIFTEEVDVKEGGCVMAVMENAESSDWFEGFGICEVCIFAKLSCIFWEEVPPLG